MINLNLFAGQISEPIEVGAGARITTLGSGKVQYLAGTLSDARNNNGTWTDWPRGSTAGSDDVLRRMVIRGVATGVMTITIDEEKQDEAPDGAYFDSQLATFTTDASGNTVMVGADGRGIQSRNLRHNVLSRCPVGHLQANVGFGAYTTHITAALAGRPIAMRIGFPNLIDGTPTVAGSFGFDTTLGAVNSTQDKGGSVAAWTPLTFAGAASGTHTARVNATTPTYVFTDWIGCNALERTDGVDGAILHLNLVSGVAAGDATWFGSIWAANSTTESVATHVWRGYRSNAATDYATTNQSLFPANSGSAVAGHLACIIQYATITEGVTILVSGDSISAGTASADVMVANGYGWAAKARDLLSTAALPVEVCNLGWPGSTAAQALARFELQAPYFEKALFMPMVFSTNDASPLPLTAAHVSAMKSALGRILAIANQYNMVPMLRTSTPCNATVAAGGIGGASAKDYAAGDPLRVAFDAEVMAGSQLKFDVATVLSGSAVASGTSIGQIEYSPAKTTDGVHPNDSGYTDWAVALDAVLKPML